jgi:uncharacterized membrane protein
MSDRNFRMPNLSRDLALIGGGIIAVAVAVGAAIGVTADVLVHRHRAAR